MKFPRLCVKESFDQSLPDDHLLGYMSAYYQLQCPGPFRKFAQESESTTEIVLSCSETELTEHLLCLFLL